MIRKATAFVLLLVLGLYLPAAATSACICLGPQNSGVEESCCVEIPSCCEDHESESKSCCGNTDCCIVIPPLPDGMEPQLIEAPLPVALPAPLLIEEAFANLPSCKELPALVFPAAPAPPPEAPVRIAFGVWRL